MHFGCLALCQLINGLQTYNSRPTPFRRVAGKLDKNTDLVAGEESAQQTELLASLGRPSFQPFPSAPCLDGQLCTQAQDSHGSPQGFQVNFPAETAEQNEIDTKPGGRQLCICANGGKCLNIKCPRLRNPFLNML